MVHPFQDGTDVLSIEIPYRDLPTKARRKTTIYGNWEQSPSAGLRYLCWNEICYLLSSSVTSPPCSGVEFCMRVHKFPALVVLGGPFGNPAGDQVGGLVETLCKPGAKTAALPFWCNYLIDIRLLTVNSNLDYRAVPVNIANFIVQRER